jgi:Sec-independent protein translocase protein TatA
VARLVVILLACLIVLGPADFPKILRLLGRAMADLRRASDGLGGIVREMGTLDSEELPPSGKV